MEPEVLKFVWNARQFDSRNEHIRNASTWLEQNGPDNIYAMPFKYCASFENFNHVPIQYHNVHTVKGKSRTNEISLHLSCCRYGKIAAKIETECD